MKQNLPPAKAKAPLRCLLMIAVVPFASACATLPRAGFSEAQLHLDPTRVARTSLIDINTATAQQLERLPGVGKGIADRIVAHREQYGPFRRVEHLMMVRGISDRKFRALRPLITVN